MALLVYDFKVVHDQVVHQALASIERRAFQSARNINRAFGSASGTPVTRTTSTSAVAARARGNADATARAEQRAAAQATLYWQRAAQKSADHRIREDQRAHRTKLRQISQEEAAAKRAANAEARERASAASALDRQRARALAAQFRAAERQSLRDRGERIGRARAVLGTAGRSVAGTLGAVGSYGAAAVGLAGTFAVGSAMQTQIAESARASQLANQAGKPGIKGELLREAQATKGFTGMEALGGLGSFVDVTGDLETARKLLPDMSRVAIATATDLGELGSAMGTAFIPLADAIKDPEERLKALNNVMKATAGMGAVGAVEVKDLAREMSGLAATSSKFAGNSQDNLNFMVAMAQATRQRGGASSAAEAVTSVERFGSDIITKQKDLKTLGVDVFERDAAGVRSKLRDPRQVMLDILKATKGDISKIGGIFGERSIRAVQGFSPLYTAAEAENAKLDPSKRLKVGEAGTAAVKAEMDRLLKATVTDEQINERVTSQLSEPEMLLKENMKKFNAAIGTELVPVLVRMVPEFTKLIPSIANAAKALAGFVEEAVKNPVSAMLKIIGAKLALDLASAGIGAAVKNTLTRIIGGSGASIPVPGGGVVPTAATGKAGGFGAALGAGGAITLAATSVFIAADQYNDLSKQTGGSGGILAGIGAILNGESFEKGVDDYLNEQATNRAADPFSQENIDRRAREAAEPVSGPSKVVGSNDYGKLFRAPAAETAASQAKDLVGTDVLSAGANELKLAATALTGAATALVKAGPNRGDAPKDPTKG